MPINKETLNKRLEKALGRFRAKPVDTSGEVIPLADEADAFKFNFIKDGEDYGTVYATIDDTSTLTLWFDDAVMDSPSAPTPGVDYNDTWFGFLEYMKKWALNNQLRFNKDNKDHLGTEMARRKSMKQKEQIAEGYHAMGKKASYNDAVPNVKIVLQHSKVMQEGEQRFRHIEKIFVENANGERFLVPTTRPGLARVFARHIAEGGTPYDERAGHIQSLVEEYNKMAGFVRATRNGQFNESAQQLVTEGINHYVKLRESLSKMTGHRGYTAYFESWTPSLMEDESDAGAINELFVQETLDPRIESVMPILSRLHKQVAEMKEVSALDEWAESLLSEKMVMGADTDASSGGTSYSNIEEEEGIQSKNPVGIPEDEVEEGKTGPGLWANIHAKRERIKHGSHEKMRKPGSKGAPSAQNFRDAAKEDVEMDEDRNVHTFQYHDPKEDKRKTYYAKAGSKNAAFNEFKKFVAALKAGGEKVAEDLGPEQKRVGQLGPTEKVGPKGAVGKLVGASESIENTMRVLESIETTPLLEGRVDSPVSQAITRRILNQRHDLLKYGPEKVMAAIDDVAEWVDLGPDDEIGSSDVSGWVNQVARYLQTQAGEGLEEGADYGDLENDLYYVVDAQSGEVVDGPFDNTGEIPLRLMGFDGGHKVKKGAELKGHDEVDENFINMVPQAVAEDQDGRPYVCVHAKKGQCEVTATSSYDAAKKAAQKWNLKNTSGIDCYLADKPVDASQLDEGQEDLDAILRIIRK